MSERRIVIIRAMLASYHDVCGPGDTGQGSGDITDDRLLMMNPLWHQGTFAELHRCLYELREAERRIYWHVSQRYLRAIRRQVRDHCPVCKAPAKTIHTHTVGGLPQQFRPQDVVIETWNPKVELPLVEKGVTWIADEHRGEPFLPKELMDRMAA